MAAAICIGSGLSVCGADILSARAATVRAAKGGTDFRRYPDAMRFSSNDYFFFFLAVFLGCLALPLRFLGHIALRDPKSLVQCKSTIDMHHSEYTTITKLILRASRR